MAMTKTYTYSVFLLILFMLAACERSHPQVEAILQKSDVLIEEHPDSTFSLLDSLHFSQQLSKKETARYALLIAKATDKTSKNTPDRAMALLYKGRLEEEIGQTERALPLLEGHATLPHVAGRQGCGAYTDLQQCPERLGYLRCPEL